MSRVLALLLIVGGALLPAHAGADVIITLDLSDAEGNALTGPVPSGTTVFAELLLAADGEDNPLPDIRLIQFDFIRTSETLTVQEFEWTFDPGQGQDLYFISSALPLPQVAYIQLSGIPGFILDLGGDPVSVATFEVVVTDAGTLDALGADLEGPDAGAWVKAGFDPTQSFQAVLGNLSGGTAELTVVDEPTPGGGEPGDSDQDGDPDPGDPGGEPGDGDDDGGDPGEPGGDDPDDGSDDGDDGDAGDGDDAGDDTGDDNGDDPTTPGDNGGDPGDGDGGTADPGDGGDAVGDADGQAGDGAAGRCGPAMIGPSLFSLGILSAVRMRRRLIPRPRG